MSLDPRTRAFAEQFRGRPRAILEESQRSALLQQLRRLSSVPFFAERLRPISDDLDNAGPLDLARFAELVPTMTKADVLSDQEKNSPWGSRLAVDPNLLREATLTNGTSGTGREAFGLTAEDVYLNALSGVLLMEWAGLGHSHTTANLFPVGFGLAGLAASHAADVLGWNIVQTGFLGTREKLEAFRRFGVDVLWVCTPSYLARLIVEARESGGLEQVKVVMLAGEAYPPEFVDAIEDEFGFRLIEAYGSTQLAVFGGGTCPDTLNTTASSRLLHVLEPWILAEVLGSDGAPVDDGEEGELVVTPLYRMASPVLRFRTGDKVRLLPAGSCGCGRPFRLIEAGTIGRIDDMIKVKGVNLWPTAVDHILLAIPDSVDYSAEVGIDGDGREFIRATIATTRSYSAVEIDAVTERLRSATGLHIDVGSRVVTAHDLRAEAGHKSRRWSDSRQETLGRLALGSSQ